MTAAADEAVDLEEVRRIARNLVTYAKYVEEHLKAGRIDSAEWWLKHIEDGAKMARDTASQIILAEEKGKAVAR